MKKVVLKILFIVVLFLGLNRMVANAAVTGTSATIEPGEQATITIKSDKKVACFQLDVLDLDGLELVTMSSDGAVNIAEKTIAYAELNGTNTLATITVKAPTNATAKTYNIKISAYDMEAPAGASAVPETATVTAKVTVKEEETTPPPSDGNTTGGGNTSDNGSSSNGGSNTGSGNTGNTSTPKPETDTKSSDANLSNIITSPVDFTGFRSYKTSGYEITVDNNVTQMNFACYVGEQKINDKERIYIYNKANSDHGSIWVYLAEGRNEIDVTHTSEDGTNKKTYTVVVNRLAKEDSEPNNEEENPNEEETPTEGETEEQELALTSLSIDGITISPTFKADVYEYTAKLEDMTVDSLKVDAKANIEGATVEVTGNENLVEGENTITILLKYEDKSATYQITVTKVPKAVVDNTSTNTLSNTTETAATAENKNSGGLNLPMIIGIGVVGIIILAAVIALIVTKVKFRKNNGVDLNFIDDIGNDDNNNNVRIRQNGEDKIEIEDDDQDGNDNRGKGRRGRHF